MDLFLVLMLAINVLISVWNCYAVGSAWKDTMTLGGGFAKFLLWCGVIQSAVGFSMPLLLGLSYGTMAYLTSGAEPTITVQQGQHFMQWILSFWYVVIIFPILGTGFAITAHSLQMAYRHRDLGSIAAAMWNVSAQISNTLSALENLGGMLGHVGDLFTSLNSDDDKEWLAYIALLIATFALLGGFMIAFVLVKHFARNHYARVEQFAHAQQRG